MIQRFGLLLFTTGFCALVYQVTWLRMLRHVFGGSTASTAAVLAIFMGGLGLGGALIGRRAGKMGNPLELYAKLEIGIALSAAASPWLIELVRVVYFGLAGIAPPGTVGSIVIRLLLSALVLLIPTTLMGATLPAVAHALEHTHDPNRRRTALYYGLNSAGAVLGTLATTFLLLETLGIRNSLYLAAAVNLLAAMTARHLARQLDADPAALGADAPRSEPLPVAAEPAAAAPVPAAPRPGKTQIRVILATSFGVGFVFFLMEIVWYRMLAPILGGSSFTFGLILAMALLGIAAGGLLFSRRPENLPPRFSALALTCALEGLCLVVPYVLGDRLAIFAASVRNLEAFGFAGLAFGWALVAAVVVLPTAIVAGYQFPLLIALLGGGRDEVAPEVGAAAACNTFGAIAGSLAGGFGLMPLFGAPGLWRFDVWLLCALAVALAVAGRRQVTRGRAVLVGLVAFLACAATFAQGPTGLWRDSGIGVGRFVRVGSPSELKKRQNYYQIGTLASRDGVEGHFTVFAEEEAVLFNNGKSDGSAVGDSPTTVMLGLVPALIHPEPRQALVIGLGTGTTAGWLGKVDSIERVDAVELEKVVGEVAHYFEGVNESVMENPKVSLAIADGRAWLQTSGRQYDVIASEPSNPYRAGVADLFSQDFYETTALHLRPNGLLAQWLQGYELDSSMMRMVVANLHSVFPHVEVWQLLPGDLLFLASMQPIVHDFDRARVRSLQEPYRSALTKVWKVEPAAESFYSGFIGSNALAAELTRDTPVSTDDRPKLEFGFARAIGTQRLDMTGLRQAASRLNADLPSPSAGAPLDAERLREARLLRDLLGEAPPSEAGQPLGLRNRARSAFRRGQPKEAARLWIQQGEAPRHPEDFMLMAHSLALAGDPRAAQIAEVLGTEVDRQFVLATLARARGEGQAAFDHLLRCLHAMRTEAFFFRVVFGEAVKLGLELLAEDHRRGEALMEAMSQPFAVHLYDAARREELQRVSLAVPKEKGACLEIFGAIEPYPFWNAESLEMRLLCYTGHQHRLADQAARDLQEFRSSLRDTFDELGGELSRP